MSVASSSELPVRRPVAVLRALIEQARRRARRRRTVALLVVTAVAVALLLLAHDTPVAGSAGGAKPTVLKTNWSERMDYANGEGFLRLYVRRIEFTGTHWTAAVGLRNSSTIAVQLLSRLERPNANLPFIYWAGPGIWWSRYLDRGSWLPGAGAVLTHSARGTARPKYPTRLAAGKSWFGTFSGSLAKVPRDRLLRIGFGTLVLPGNMRDVTGPGTGIQPRELAVSTTHHFRLPKGIR